MKVLGILPHSIGGRLTISSIFDGFKMLNHKLVIFDELYDKVLPSGDFDLICGYDFSALKIKTDNKLNIKSLNYFSDVIKSPTSGPEWQKYYPYLENSDNYNFLWDKELAKQEKNAIYFPHFVNCEIYKNLNLEAQCDVMFAGRLDTDYRLNTVINLMMELPQLKFHWYSIERHYNDALNRTNQKALIRRAYQGFIDNEADMAKAINKSRIIYNINSQGISSLNYRTFQAAACEKVVISDFREELSLFKGNMPHYSDFEDLKRKILLYLLNEELYNKTAKSLRETMINNHHSLVCVQKMIDKITC